MRALRWAAASLLALVLSMAALVSGLWVWSGSEGSLTTALQLAQTWLPRVLHDGQTLVVQNANGVLREGGSVGLLQWRHGAQVVDIQDLQIRWDWRALQAGRLHLPLLKAAIGAITWLGLMAEIRRVYFMPVWMVRLGYHRQPSALAIATAKQAILLY